MSIVTPWRYVAKIEDISLTELQAQGIDTILYDRDNTVVPSDKSPVPKEVYAFFAEAKELGFKLCMVSNNFHSKAVEASAEEFGTEVVHHALKPAPFALWRALKLLGTRRESAVMIGDQLFTDVCAGNLSGVRTILVRPQSASDLWYTQLMRKVEKRILADVAYEGE